MVMTLYQFQYLSEVETSGARQAKEGPCTCGTWLGWGTRRMLLGIRMRTIHDAGNELLTTYRATMIFSRASR